MTHTQIQMDEKTVFVPFEEIRSIEHVLHKLEQAQQELERALARAENQSKSKPKGLRRKFKRNSI